MNGDILEVRELNALYHTHFSSQEIDSFVDDVKTDFLEKNFIQDIITNAQYEKNVFKSIQKLISIRLEASCKKQKNTCKMISEYIFKKQFKLIFYSITESLLKEIVKSNENVINFLHYYSLDIIIVDRIKYKVPQIKEENGPIWNVTSMLRPLKAYIKAQEIVVIYENKINALNLEIQTYYVDSLSPEEYNDIITQEYELLELAIREHESRINILRDALLLLKDEGEISATNDELKVFIEYRAELRQNKAKIISKKIKQYKIEAYQNLVKEVNSIRRSSQIQYDIMDENKNAYKSIKNSLFKALISKKKSI